jgi:hypothetical protein
VTVEKSISGRLRNAYPVGRYDSELVVRQVPPGRLTAVLLADALIAGENCDYVFALAWLSPAEAVRLRPEQPGSPDGEVLNSAELAGHIGREPAAHNAGKGYVNQRRALANRSHLVQRLYAAASDAIVPLVEETL